MYIYKCRYLYIYIYHGSSVGVVRVGSIVSLYIYTHIYTCARTIDESPFIRERVRITREVSPPYIISLVHIYAFTGLSERQKIDPARIKRALDVNFGAKYCNYTSSVSKATSPPRVPPTRIQYI